MNTRKVLLGIIALIISLSSTLAGRYEYIRKQYELAITQADYTSEMVLSGDYTRKDIEKFSKKYQAEYGINPFLGGFGYKASYSRKWGGYRPYVATIHFLKPQNESLWIDYYSTLYQKQHKQYRSSSLKDWLWGLAGAGIFVAVLDYLWNRNASKIENEIQTKYTIYKFEECLTPTKNPRNLYVLAISTNKDLGGDAYAQDVSNMFKAQCGKEDLFGNIYVKVLKAHETTKRGIQYALKNITEKTNENDIFFLYFIGHGWNDGGKFLFYPDSVMGDDPISVDEILTALDTDNGKTIFFFESCYSGAAEANFLNKVDDYIIGKKLSQVTVMMSSSDEEESTPTNGFSEALIEGLRGWADFRRESGNQNGIVSLQELMNYIKMQVPKRTYGKQHPQILNLGTGVETRLSKYIQTQL